jgi:hypothetical protein
MAVFLKGFVFKIMKYSEKLKHPKWQKKRLEILSRDNFSCQLCSDSETELHVHHLNYTKEPQDAPNEDLQTLCKTCHSLVEYLKDVLDKNEKPIVKKFKGKIILTSNKHTFIVTIKNQLITDDVLIFERNSEILEYLYKTNKL